MLNESSVALLALAALAALAGASRGSSSIRSVRSLTSLTASSPGPKSSAPGGCRWRFRATPEALKLGSEYLWGRDLLVAPVVEKGARARRLYLPAGDWYDWWTGERLAGGRWIERPVDLATLPLYARAGAVIPLDPVRQHTAEPATEPTALRVHADAGGAFTLYDDDGVSLGYRDGSDPRLAWIRCRWDDAARRLTLEPAERQPQRPGAARVFTVEAAGGSARPQRVELRGEAVQVEL
ncbi:MAG: DUF5110 domain-containing protein [Planctomycetes bacterium]|nr:DUF5110 domain-containing protein [Planctomycetota bacterium]